MYTPRLTDEGIRGNPYWYADNVYYTSGYGMPNCTAYALGRWYELQGSAKSFNFPRYGDGKEWYSMGVQAGLQHSPTVPLLGSAASWDYSGGGHVAVVEKINYNEDGTVNNIVTSNSAYRGTFFYTQTLYASNGFRWRNDSTLNGFIYHPSIEPEPTPTPPTKQRKLPLWMMLRPF